MFRTPGPLVYGTITVGALLDAESSRVETFAETVAGVTIAMLLYWLAHSYAQITGERVEQGRRLTFGLVANKMAHELSILTGAAVPLLTVAIWWATGGALADALTAGIWTSAAMIVLVNVVAGVEAKLSGAALVVQTTIGVVLGLGIIAMKLIFQ